MKLGQKIIVVGCPGSGKSTLSKELRDVTGLPLFHLDNIWWKPDKSHISREEFDQKLDEILLTDRWMIDGNYSRTYEVRFRACDTVIFLDYPVDVCMNGIKERIGKNRTDIPWTEQALDSELVKLVEPRHIEYGIRHIVQPSLQGFQHSVAAHAVRSVARCRGRRGGRRGVVPHGRKGC